jgi:hypothetical protein
MLNCEAPPPRARIYLGSQTETWITEKQTSSVALQTIHENRLIKDWLVVGVERGHKTTGEDICAPKLFGLLSLMLDATYPAAKLESVVACLPRQKVLQLPACVVREHLANLRAATNESAAYIQRRIVLFPKISFRLRVN